MKQWRDSLEDTLKHGKFENDRTDTGTYRRFGVLSRYNMLDGFPLETLKWANFKAIKVETIWMLSGSTNIRYLKEHGVSIWDAHVIPETAVFVPMDTKVLLERTQKMEGFDFELLRSQLVRNYKAFLVREPALVNAVTDRYYDVAFNGLTTNYRQVLCPRLSGDEKKDQVTILLALIEDMLEQGVHREEIIYETSLYSYHQCPEWMREIMDLRAGGTAWPIELTAGELGPIYGAQWTRCPKTIDPGDLAKMFEDSQFSRQDIIDHLWNLNDNPSTINQVQNCVDGLLEKPTDRRHMVNSWNVAMLADMSLPPCHFNFQFLSEAYAASERFDSAMALDENFEEDWQAECWESKQEGRQASATAYLDANDYPTRGLSVVVTMRSNDAFIGEPFNVAQYALLLHMMARATNHFPKELILFRGDYHIYADHLDAVNKVLKEKERPLCRLRLKPSVKNIFDFKPDDISVVNYTSGPYVPAPVAVKRDN